MLNINNLNRARRILSAEYGAKAPSVPGRTINYFWPNGDEYNYTLSPIGVGDQAYSQLNNTTSEGYQKQQTESEGNRKYISVKSYKDSNGKDTYYGVTSDGNEVPIPQKDFNQLVANGIRNETNEEQVAKGTSLSVAQSQNYSKGLFVDQTKQERYETNKDQERKLADNQSVSNEKLVKASNPNATTQSTQPTTSAQQNTALDPPQVTTTDTKGNTSGTNTSTGSSTSTEESEESEAFKKGHAAGLMVGKKVGDFLNSDGVKVAGEIGEKAGEVADAVSGMVRSGNNWAPQTGFENTWDQTSTLAMEFGPLGKAIGGGMKVAKAISDIGGGLFGIKTQDFAEDTATLETVGGSYGGSSALIKDAANKAGKNYGLFGIGAKNKANKLINKARIQQYAMQGIADDARDLNSMRSYMDPYYMQYESNISGGYDQRYMHVAKLGGTISLNRGTALQNSLLESYKKGGTIEFKAEITGTEVYDYWEPIIDFDEISLLKEGGSIKQPEIEVIETNTVQKSVIPDGALHKNKHNLDKVGVDDKEMTKKGIPVVDNNGEQQAEIELNEIIFTLEVTKELEKRYREYYEDGTKQSRKDELALEAGKLLWKEILYNTDDRTGLIDTLKHGGSITKSKENNAYQSAIDFYKNLGYTPQNYEFIKSSDLRTEGNKLYVNTDEDAVHELWHFISKNVPDERFQEFYKDLSDSKISELGGDLKFVNRTGNPQDFYDPSELLARLFAAKYRTQGNSYTKEFFKNARANENKYGYNFRDLLHMYDDDNLVKLFSFKLNNEYKKDNEGKRPFEDWIITVNPDYISPNYDLETAYKYVNPEQLKRWRSAVNSDNPERELNQKDAETGEFVNHLPSVAPYGEGDYIFLKKGTVDENPEVQDEIDAFKNGKTGLEKTHELIFNPEENRYFYIKKSSKFKNGGNLEQALLLLKSGGEFQIIQDDVKTLINNGDYELTTDKDKLDDELEQYFTGTNGIAKTHDLVWDNSHNRYFYRKKVDKKQLGGIVDYAPVETSEEAVVKKVRDSLNLLKRNLFPEYIEWPSTTSGTSNSPAPSESSYYTTQSTSDHTSELTPPEKTSESTQVPDNLNLDGWDLEKTLKHLREHAHDKSTHYCARYVRQALEAGGLVGFRVPSAKDEVKLNTLASIGFKKIAEANDDTTSPGYTPQAGDIAITFENGNHAAMYDGTKWISDFRQKGLDVYHKRKNSRAYIYRRVSDNPSQLNTILINKTNRTLSVGDKVFKVSISKKGIENTSKKGDNLTPEGEFTLGEKETKGGYNDPEYGNRPNAYGGKFYRLSGGSAEDRGFGIHGSDQYNDPDNYQIGKYGTHGCIAMKNSDLEELEQIIQSAGGPSNFKVKIIKASSGAKLTKVRSLSKIILNR